MSSSSPGSVTSIGTSGGMKVPGVSPWAIRPLALTTVQITLTGTGQVDCVVDVEVSNGPAAAPIPTDTPAAVIILTSAAGQASDGFSVNLPWRYIRFKIVSISGTGATVTALLGA